MDPLPFKSSSCCNSNQGPNGSILCDRRVSFVVIFTPTLCEAFRTKPRLMQTTVLHPVNPPRSHNFGLLWKRDQLPTIILYNGCKLCFHRNLPLLRISTFHHLAVRTGIYYCRKSTRHHPLVRHWGFIA